MRAGIPTYMEYAWMSCYAHSHHPEERDYLDRQGWDVMDAQALHEGDEDKKGILFIHDRRKQVVLASYADTAGIPVTHERLQADVHRLFKLQPDVLMLHRLLLSSRNGVSIRDTIVQAGYDLSFTGYSFGGFLAEWSVYVCHLSGSFAYPEAHAVTLESPGSLEVMEEQKAPLAHCVSLRQLNIIGFLSSPNDVNTLY